MSLPPVPDIIRSAYATLVVTDLAEARRFWVDLLGFVVTYEEFLRRGEIAGEFDADTVQLSGTVKDNTVVRAKSLEVKLAVPGSKMQVVFGECELAVGDEPSKEAAIASALTPPAEPAKPPAAVKATNSGSDDAAAKRRRNHPGTEPPPSPT